MFLNSSKQTGDFFLYKKSPFLNLVINIIANFIINILKHITKFKKKRILMNFNHKTPLRGIPQHV